MRRPSLRNLKFLSEAIPKARGGGAMASLVAEARRRNTGPAIR
jgi:hypothetical protein